MQPEVCALIVHSTTKPEIALDKAPARLKNIFNNKSL